MKPKDEKAKTYMREIVGYIERLRGLPYNNKEDIEKLGDAVEAAARDIILVIAQDTIVNPTPVTREPTPVEYVEEIWSRE